jgi:hypothetical protein
MKTIQFVKTDDCLACEIVDSIIFDSIFEGNIPDDIDVREDTYNNAQVRLDMFDTLAVPLLIFRVDDKEVARITGSMPADFYKTVINKFIEL